MTGVHPPSPHPKSPMWQRTAVGFESMWSVTSWLTLDLLDVNNNKRHWIEETWNWVAKNVPGFQQHLLYRKNNQKHIIILNSYNFSGFNPAYLSIYPWPMVITRTSLKCITFKIIGLLVYVVQFFAWRRSCKQKKKCYSIFRTTDA